MRKINICFALALLVALFASQFALAQNRTLPILDTPTDARAAGMGNFNTMSTDRSYLYVNPASMLYGDKHFTVSGNMSMFMQPKVEGIEGTLSMENISAGWRFLDRHVVYAGFRYQGGINIVGKAAGQFDGVTKGNLTPFDWTVDLGYAFRFNDKLAAFATASFVQNYTGRRTAYAYPMTLGVNYLTDLNFGGSTMAKLNAVAKIADFGAPMYYSASEGYALPTSAHIVADLAMPFNENNQLSVALGGRYFFLPADAQVMQVNLGAEYTLYNIASLRAGYQYGSRDTSLWTAGLGFKYSDVKLDFAYLGSMSEFKANKLVFTLSYDF